MEEWEEHRGTLCFPALSECAVALVGKALPTRSGAKALGAVAERRADFFFILFFSKRQASGHSDTLSFIVLCRGQADTLANGVF